MIRPARAAGIKEEICCYPFRATGITAYRNQGAHSSPRTARLYDRSKEEITLDEVEKIQL